jgi:hypothetical protein
MGQACNCCHDDNGLDSRIFPHMRNSKGRQVSISNISDAVLHNSNKETSQYPLIDSAMQKINPFLKSEKFDKTWDAEETGPWKDMVDGRLYFGHVRNGQKHGMGV